MMLLLSFSVVSPFSESVGLLNCFRAGQRCCAVGRPEGRIVWGNIPVWRDCGEICEAEAGHS